MKSNASRLFQVPSICWQLINLTPEVVSPERKQKSTAKKKPKRFPHSDSICVLKSFQFFVSPRRKTFSGVQNWTSESHDERKSTEKVFVAGIFTSTSPIRRAQQQRKLSSPLKPSFVDCIIIARKKTMWEFIDFFSLAWTTSVLLIAEKTFHSGEEEKTLRVIESLAFDWITRIISGDC